MVAVQGTLMLFAVPGGRSDGPQCACVCVSQGAHAAGPRGRDGSVVYASGVGLACPGGRFCVIAVTVLEQMGALPLR